MIGRLHGTLLAKQPPALLLDVAGVGYELEAPMSTFYDLPLQGGQVTLFTHLAIRDDAHVLYGFATDSERALFRMLLKVSGVGAKMALAMEDLLQQGQFDQADQVVLIHTGGLQGTEGFFNAYRHRINPATARKNDRGFRKMH